MRGGELDILYEDNHLLAVSKPAGIATSGTPADRVSLHQLAKRYLKRRYAKAGNVYLGIVSRLDAPVSGVILFAKTSKAAARLTEAFRRRAVEKTYWALVEGRVHRRQGRLVDWLRKNEQRRRVETTLPNAVGAKEARLSYRRLRIIAESTWLEIALETGRKHQIRVQLARLGHPVLGDRKYGAKAKFPGGISLHAARLTLDHPVLRKPIILKSPLPESWNGYIRRD